MKLLKNLTAVSLSALLAFSAAALVSAASDDGSTGAQVISVSAADLESNAHGALQNALDTAAKQATESDPVTVKAAAGSYILSRGLKIFDNTTLDLSGVTLKRDFEGNMLRVGSEDSVNTGAVGYKYKNIKLFGGTYDGNQGDRTMLKVAHTKDFTMESVSVVNEREGHMMEVAGCDGFTAKGCTFRDQILSPGKDGFEAIQFDILHPKHVVNCRAEDLNCKNILVENCVFDNVPRAVGTHTGILNNPFDGIKIYNNVFKNLKSIAVQGMNWINVDIRMNVIEKAPRGITVYSVMEDGSGMYMSSDLSSLGKTTSHVSSAYQTPKKANITVCYNTLKNVGSLNDIYSSYECQGIAVLGNKLNKVYPKNTRDGSGGLPIGDYYNDGASVYGNYIDIRGNGVRLEDVRNGLVSRNEIICSKNTVKPANYYGVVLRSNAQVNNIEYNTIKNAEVNGIQIDSCKVGAINYNDIISPGKYGMGAYTTKIGSITDNYVTSAKSEGITLLWSSSADKIKWNRVRSCSGTGIKVLSDSSSGDISSNLTYKCGNGISAPNKGSNYTSPAALTKFYLVKSGVKMGVGTAYKIVPDVRPVNAVESFSYSSADSAVASVDSCGRIAAKKNGNTTVTVTSSNGIKQTYRVEVTSGSGVSYIEQQALAAPQITKFESTADGVKLTWGKVDGAYGYRVFYKSSSGWKAMGNTTGTSFVDADVKSGSKYTYTVRCVDANGSFTSGYNNTGWTYTYQSPQLDTPQITKFESTAQGIRLTWNKINGAYGYRVFYKGASGWKGMGNVTGNTYLDSNVTNGKTYTYTVRCVDANGNFTSGYNNTGWACKYAYSTTAYPEFTLANESNGVRIRWNGMSGIYGYKVFYKNSSGGWTSMGTVTGASYLDTKVRSGSSYTYTVRGVDANGIFVTSYLSSGKTIKFAGSNQSSSGSFASYPAAVNRGEYATVKYRGAANTKYTITVYYSSGASTADGLGTKTSDSSGNVSWTWKVGNKTKPGTYRIQVTGSGKTQTVNFTVK